MYSGFTLFSFYLTASLLLAMRHYQHYEFQRHWRKFALLSLIFNAIFILVLCIVGTAVAGLLA